MLCRPAAAAVLVPALLGPGRPTVAVELPEPPSAEAGFIEVGAFHFKPDLTLKNVGYDSNVFFSNDNKEGDYTFTLGPSLDAVVLFGHRGRLDIREAVDVVRFVSISSQNHVDNATDADWQVMFADFLYKGGIGFSTAKTRPNDEIIERTRLEQRHIHGELDWSRTRKAEFFFRFEATNLDYRNNVGTLRNVSDLNRDEIVTSFGGRFRIRPKTSLSLEVRREDHEFDDPALGRDATGFRLVPGLTFDDSAIVQGELKVGILDFEPDDPGRTGYDGLVAKTTLSRALGSRLRVTFGYERDVIFSIFGNNLYYLLENTEIEVHTSLSTRFRLELGGSFGRNTYPDPVNLVTLQGRRRDQLRTAWVGGSYAPPGAPRIGLRLQLRERTSNLPEAEYDNLRIVGTATYTF